LGRLGTSSPTIGLDRFRSRTLAGVRTALKACAPDLDASEADDVAAGVLNNMKTMVGMTMKDAPTSPGAPDQLRLMNRLFLAAKLSPGCVVKADIRRRGSTRPESLHR
jgi:hypothetical protein